MVDCYLELESPGKMIICLITSQAAEEIDTKDTELGG